MVIANGYTPVGQSAEGKEYAREARQKLQLLYPRTFTSRTRWIPGHYLTPEQTGRVRFTIFLFADDC